MCPEFPWHAYAHGNSAFGDFIGFFNCAMRLEKAKPVIEFEVECIFPV